MVRRRFQCQPRIAGHDRRPWRATRQELEAARIMCDADHFGIDLEERPDFSAPAVTGQRAGTEADDGNTVEAAANGARGADGAAERTSKIVIGQWRQRTGDRRAIVVSQALGAMDGRTVIEQARPAVGNLRDLVDAEETACRLNRRNPG